LSQAKTVTIGRLGRFDFAGGNHVYVGSAFGPGGLRARLGRHMRKEKRLHWHIDYLLEEAQLCGIWQAPGVVRRECQWAQALAELVGSQIPVPGFGASDCDCVAHLYHFGADFRLASLTAALASDEGVEFISIA
jgi:Uri superfamily endonuclease